MLSRKSALIVAVNILSGFIAQRIRILASALARMLQSRYCLPGIMAALVIGGIAIGEYVLHNEFFDALVRVPLMILLAFAGVTGIATIAPELGIDVICPVTWPAFLSPIQTFIAAHAVGALAMCYATGFGAVFLVATWLLRRYPIKRYNKELAKSYLVFALPVMLLSITSIIAANVDKVMLGYFWTFKEVG